METTTEHPTVLTRGDNALEGRAEGKRLRRIKFYNFKAMAYAKKSSLALRRTGSVRLTHEVKERIHNTPCLQSRTTRPRRISPL
jgi:hypothetical protein